MKGLLHGSALALCCLLPCNAQSPLPDLIRFVDSGDLRVADRFGNHRVMHQRIVGPARPGLDGATWAVSSVSPVVDVLDNRGTRISIIRPSATPVDIEPDANGDAWIAIASPNVEHWSHRPSPNGRLLASVRMPAVPTAMAIGPTGRVWVAQANTPNPFLSWFDPPSSTVQTITLGQFQGSIADVVVDQNGRVWVAGGDRLVEIDGTGTVVATHRVPHGSDVAQIALAPHGILWLRGATANVHTFDTATGEFRLFDPAPARGIAVDALGQPWVLTPRHLRRVDLERFRTDLEVSLFGGPGTLVDGAGWRQASVVAAGVDNDGDGISNGVETRMRSNPFDPQSNAAITLDVPRVAVQTGEPFVLEARGATGVAFVVVGLGRAQTPVQIPGIVGELRLETLLPVMTQISSPGRIAIPVPDDARLSGTTLWWQALHQSFGGTTLRLSNEVALRIVHRPARTIFEAFNSDAKLDRVRSGGTWSGGFGVPASIGGTGILGSFDPTIGQQIGPDTWLWNTDSMTIPGSHTLTGTPITVTGGIFEFSDLIVPAGQTVLFRGSKPAVLRVRGQVMIAGRLAADGATADPDFDATAKLVLGQWVGAEGQPGTSGGAFGGRGGDGADGCDGLGSDPLFFGQRGGDLMIPASSGYASMGGGTGGSGGPLFPATGLHADVTFNLFASISGQIAGGGGGGAFLGAGAPGLPLVTFTAVPGDLGPQVPGGSAVAFVPLPAGRTSLEHFLVGGAGGGGGGSQPLGMTTVEIQQEKRAWHAGGAGTGGGGALALRAGGGLSVAANGVVSARGGRGAVYDLKAHGPASPGGSGSGGTVLMQVEGSWQQAGMLDVSGGNGSALRTIAFNGQPARSVGGAGGHGYVRLETPTPLNPSALGTVVGPTVGPDHVGALRDRDSWSGFQSEWYPINATTPPTWLSYTIDVIVGGQRVTFSDDPSNFRPANAPGLPIRVFVQGAMLDRSGEPAGEPGPWRDFVGDAGGTPGLNADRASGFRFLVLFDRSVQQDVRIDTFAVRYR